MRLLITLCACNYFVYSLKCEWDLNTVQPNENFFFLSIHFIFFNLFLSKM